MYVKTVNLTDVGVFPSLLSMEGFHCILHIFLSPPFCGDIFLYTRAYILIPLYLSISSGKSKVLKTNGQLWSCISVENEVFTSLPSHFVCHHFSAWFLGLLFRLLLKQLRHKPFNRIWIQGYSALSVHCVGMFLFLYLTLKSPERPKEFSSGTRSIGGINSLNSNKSTRDEVSRAWHTLVCTILTPSYLLPMEHFLFMVCLQRA